MEPQMNTDEHRSVGPGGRPPATGPQYIYMCSSDLICGSALPSVRPASAAHPFGALIGRRLPRSVLPAHQSPRIPANKFAVMRWTRGSGPLGAEVVVPAAWPNPGDLPPGPSRLASNHAVRSGVPDRSPTRWEPKGWPPATP
jgi:hypothetical protein